MWGVLILSYNNINCVISKMVMLVIIIISIVVVE